MKKVGHTLEPIAPTKHSIPPGSPRWVTSELTAETIRVWQPYYQKPLTPDDALSMIINVGQLLDLLGGTGG